MSGQIHILNAAGLFSKEAVEKIENCVFDALRAVQAHLPATPVNIVVMDDRIATVPEEQVHIGGRSINASTMFIYFDASYSTADRIDAGELKRVVAHEYHHVSRWKTVGYGSTLAEALITEGLADHFSMQVFPGAAPKWCTALPPDAHAAWLEKADPDMHNTDYDHIAWFFGSRKIPRWTAYGLGYGLIQNYLDKHSGATAASLVDVSADVILRN